MSYTSRLDTVIETPRLILKVPSLKEFEPWCAFMADEESARYIGKAQPPSAVWRSICTMIGAWQAEGHAMFSVFEKQAGSWVGRLGPWTPHGWPGKEVGWGIIPAAQGKCYALEGSMAAMDSLVLWIPAQPAFVGEDEALAGHLAKRDAERGGVRCELVIAVVEVALRAVVECK